MSEPIADDPSQWTWPEDVLERMRAKGEAVPQPKPTEQPQPGLTVTITIPPAPDPYAGIIGGFP